MKTNGIGVFISGNNSITLTAELIEEFKNKYEFWV